MSASTLPPAAMPAATLDPSGRWLRKRFLWLVVARIAVATIIFGGTLMVYLAGGSSLDQPTPRLLLRVVTGIYACSLGYALSVRRMNSGRLRSVAMLSIVLDLAAWTVLAYATGGAVSPLSSLYGLSTLTAAMLLGGAATLWTGVGSLAAYGTLSTLMVSGFLSPLSDQVHVNAGTAEMVYQMVVTVTAVALIGALGGSLAERLAVAGDALHRAEASRADLAALYEDVLRSIPVALVTYDVQGRVDGINPEAALLLGAERGRLLGRNVSEVLPFVTVETLAPEEGSRSGDATLGSPDGSIPVAYHQAPLRHRDGRDRGGLVVVEDRSQEEALRTAIQAAERLAVLGRLAAGLAHEIRNPLGAIRGCVELVRETALLGEEDRNLLTVVTRDVARLNDLVTDMLQFARPRPPDPSPTDLAALARDVVALANAQGGHASIVLDADGPVPASVDGAQIRQVLWNLVRNASQVSRSGAEVRVRVSTRDGGAEIAVTDRGPGVRPEQRERLFEDFYSDTARGSGLGLAIVKRIAEAHGARVEVREHAGGGSVFAFVLPAPGQPREEPRGVGRRSAPPSGMSR